MKQIIRNPLLYLLITLFIGLSGSLYITKKELATAQSQAGLLQCEADVKQVEISQLEQAANQIEAELKSVLNRNEIVSELNAEHRQKSDRDREQFQTEFKLILALNGNEIESKSNLNSLQNGNEIGFKSELSSLQNGNEIGFKSEPNSFQNQFQSELKRDLNSNENDIVSNWVDDRVPVAAIRLLRYARAPGDNQNGNGNKAGASVSAGGSFQPVSGNRDF